MDYPFVGSHFLPMTLDYQFTTTQFAHAVSRLECTPLGSEITLSGHAPAGAAIRFIRIKKADAKLIAGAINELKQLMLESTPATIKAKIGNVSVGLTVCGKTGTPLIGLWITKNLEADSEVSPVLVVPMEIAATLQTKLLHTVGQLDGEFGVTRRIDLPAGVSGKFRVLITLSITENESTGRWLRIEQFFGSSYDKSAVIYIPERHVMAVAAALDSVTATGLTQVIGGVEIGRPPGKPSATQVCIRYFVNSDLRFQAPGDITKVLVRIPDTALIHIHSALRDMTGQHDA